MMRFKRAIKEEEENIVSEVTPEVAPEEVAEAPVEEVVAQEEVASEVDYAADSARAVMAAYQNANKWFDTVKEVVYIKMGCPFFSSMIHNLAHTMPGRFDKFGDILHTVNMEIPYPTTIALEKKPENITEAFDIIFTTLDSIKETLNAFIKCTDETAHGMACAAEGLLNDIEGEYPMLFRLRDKWNQCNNDMVDFDKYVMQYVENAENLLEETQTTTESETLVESLTESFDDKKEYRVKDYTNRWTIIDDLKVNGKHYGLLENNVYGDETCYLVVELGKEKDKTYTVRSTGEEVVLPTFDTIVCETFDDIRTALQDEDILKD